MGGKSGTLNAGKTTRNPNHEQISEEVTVHGTQSEQINLIGIYQENNQEKEHTTYPSAKWNK